MPLTANRPEAIPSLNFSVDGAEPVAHAVVPTLSFAVGIEAPGGQAIRSVLLDVQIQIAARARGYEPEEQERLLELFGTPDRWATTLRTLPWTRATAIVPPFTGSTVIPLAVPCSYDLEVTASRYFAALARGEVQLEFLFSGSVFFTSATGLLQTSRIALDHEVEYGLAVATWRQTMDRHFQGSAWLRLERSRFERLCSYKARHSFASWEETFDSLLDRVQELSP